MDLHLREGGRFYRSRLGQAVPGERPLLHWVSRRLAAGLQRSAGPVSWRSEGIGMSAADKLRAAAEALVLGNSEKQRQELESEIRKAQEDAKKEGK